MEPPIDSRLGDFRREFERRLAPILATGERLGPSAVEDMMSLLGSTRQWLALIAPSDATLVAALGDTTPDVAVSEIDSDETVEIVQVNGADPEDPATVTPGLAQQKPWLEGHPLRLVRTIHGLASVFLTGDEEGSKIPNVEPEGSAFRENLASFVELSAALLRTVDIPQDGPSNLPPDLPEGFNGQLGVFNSAIRDLLEMGDGSYEQLICKEAGRDLGPGIISGFYTSLQAGRALSLKLR